MARRVSRLNEQAVSGSIVVWLAGLVFGLGAGMVLVYHLVLSGRSDLTAPAPVRPVAMQASAAGAAVDPAMVAAHNAALNDRKQAN